MPVANIRCDIFWSAFGTFGNVLEFFSTKIGFKTELTDFNLQRGLHNLDVGIGMIVDG